MIRSQTVSTGLRASTELSSTHTSEETPNPERKLREFERAGESGSVRVDGASRTEDAQQHATKERRLNEDERAGDSRSVSVTRASGNEDTQQQAVRKRSNSPHTKVANAESGSTGKRSLRQKVKVITEERNGQAFVEDELSVEELEAPSPREESPTSQNGARPPRLVLDRDVKPGAH